MSETGSSPCHVVQTIYTLTPRGRSLAEAIIPLCTWGTENSAEMASIFAKRDTLP